MKCMTVKTSIGTITAGKNVLNDLAIALSQADERNCNKHGKKDCFNFRTASNEIHDFLAATGYYDSVKY